MNQRLRRPNNIQEAIEKTEKELLEFFQRIRDDREIDISKTVLVPLARRGTCILPIIDDEESQENELARIMKEFGFYERCSLFPSLDALSRFESIIIFDDVCMSGISLDKYKKYLIHLARKLGLHYDSESIKLAAYIIEKNARRTTE